MSAVHAQLGAAPERAQSLRGREAANGRGTVLDAVGLRPRMAVITGSTLIGDFQWSYQWAAIVFTSAGAYQKSTTITSATHGLAYNPMEINNTAGPGHQTTGHEVTADDALEPQPLGVGGVEVPVLLVEVWVGTTREWQVLSLLGAPNAFDGACNVVATAVDLGDVITQLTLAGIGVDGRGLPMIDGRGRLVCTTRMSADEAALYAAWGVDNTGRLILDNRGDIACDGTAPAAFDALTRAVGVDGRGLVVIESRATLAALNAA